MEALIRLTAGGRRVDLPARAIRRIVPAGDVIPVPLTWPSIAGVLTLEGQAIPVYRLAELPLTGNAAQTSDRAGDMREIVIIEQDGAVAGLLVERTDSPGATKDGGQYLADGLALLSTPGIFEHATSGGRKPQAAEGEE